MSEMVSRTDPNKFSFANLTEQEFGENDRKFTPESRYRYSVLTDGDGNRFFSKQLAGIDESLDEKWAMYLARESAWADFASSVDTNHRELGFTSLTPLHIDYRQNGGVQRLIYPYVDMPFLAEPRGSEPLHDPSTLMKYAKVLKTLDSAAEHWHSTQLLDNSDEHTPFDELDKRWDEWVEVGDLYENNVLTAEMLRDARSLVHEYTPFVSPRFQHGDFVPWHLFADPSGNWISFDGEHASMRKPRYYDVAYSYSRLFTKSRDKVTAAALLRTFIELGEAEQEFSRDEFYAAFVPVLMSRSIGMFLDAKMDGKKGDEYTVEARELFDRCQSRDLNALVAIA